MKTKTLKLYTKLVSLFLAFLGFASCSEGDMPVEYGTPSARYKMRGKIVSAEGEKKDVAGIRAVVVTGNANDKSYNQSTDTTYTNQYGEFSIDTERFPSSYLGIKFEDVDGEDNGSFEDKTETLKFTDKDYKDGDSWFKGTVDKDMGTVELTPKKDVEE